MIGSISLRMKRITNNYQQVNVKVEYTPEEWRIWFFPEVQFASRGKDWGLERTKRN